MLEHSSSSTRLASRDSHECTIRANRITFRQRVNVRDCGATPTKNESYRDVMATNYSEQLASSSIYIASSKSGIRYPADMCMLALDSKRTVYSDSCMQTAPGSLARPIRRPSKRADSRVLKSEMFQMFVHVPGRAD